MVNIQQPGFVKQFISFLIDDDPDDCEIFAMALQEVGNMHKCIIANNGMVGIEKLKQDETFVPDYIFLDLNMPLMSGKECLQEIKKIPRLGPVPVIIYTTSSHKRDIEETRQLGAVHFLIKPSSIKTLTQILSRLFQNQTGPFMLNPEIQ